MSKLQASLSSANEELKKKEGALLALQGDKKESVNRLEQQVLNIDS